MIDFGRFQLSQLSEYFFHLSIIYFGSFSSSLPIVRDSVEEKEIP